MPFIDYARLRILRIVAAEWLVQNVEHANAPAVLDSIKEIDNTPPGFSCVKNRPALPLQKDSLL